MTHADKKKNKTSHDPFKSDRNRKCNARNRLGESESKSKILQNLSYCLNSINAVIEPRNGKNHSNWASVVYYSLSHGAWTGVHSHTSPSLNHRAAMHGNNS